MTPLHPEFGVRLDSRPIGSLDMEAVRDAIDRYSFVHVPGAADGDEEHLAFTRRLGEPEANHVALGQEGRIEHFGTIGNVLPDGSVAGSTHKRTVFQTGNNMWHSDSSFRAVPSFVSIMCAYETPDEGGETLFVSQRAAWDRIEDDEQERLGPLVCVHDYVFSRSKVAPDAVTPSHAASLPPVRQRLVRRNPATGARNLYIGSHAREIEGWEFDESRGAAGRAGRGDDGRRACAEPPLAAGRPGDLGQSLPAAPGRRLRCRPLPPPHAPDPRHRRRPDPGGVAPGPARLRRRPRGRARTSCRDRRIAVEENMELCNYIFVVIRG